MLNPQLQGALEGQHLRLAVHQGQHVDAEGSLQLGMLEQLIEGRLGVRAALKLDDDAHTTPVRLVAQVGDGVDLPVTHELGDALDEGSLVHLIGQLGDDDALAVALDVLDVGLGAHDDAPATRRVGVSDTLDAQDRRASGKVGAVDELHQVIDVDIFQPLPVVDEVDAGVGNLVEVVGRNVGRHADGDARRAVEKQVWQIGGQDARLLESVVEVGVEVDGVLADVDDHLLGDAGQARLGVAHGGRWVAVDAAEVTLAVDQEVAHGEILRQAHHRIIDRAIAVGVVLAEDLADDTRALLVGPVVAEAHVEHGVQDAPLDGLEAIAHIRQGTRRDHAHGVIQIRALHLIFDVDWTNNTNFHTTTPSRHA